MAALSMSAFGGKADLAKTVRGCPLMTHSGLQSELFPPGLRRKLTARPICLIRHWLYVLIHAEKIGWIVASLCLCKTTIVRAVSPLDTVNLVGWHEVDVGGSCRVVGLFVVIAWPCWSAKTWAEGVIDDRCRQPSPQRRYREGRIRRYRRHGVRLADAQGHVRPGRGRC